MSTTCRSFRALLELKLSGRPAQSELVALSWHEHLLGCGACREMLEAEEALELLLASLPEPNLPRELAVRVISRLRASRRDELAESGLDALLDLDRSETPPAHLAQGVLARLRVAREPLVPERAPVGTANTAHGAGPNESRLDALLDLDRAAQVPDELAARVLAGLRSARLDAARARRAPRFAARSFGWMLAVAALVVASWLAWMIWSRNPTSRLEHRDELVQSEPIVPGDAESPEPQMLAVLDVLEQWDLLMHADIDVLLSTLDQEGLEPIEEPADPPAILPESAPQEPREPRSKG